MAKIAMERSLGYVRLKSTWLCLLKWLRRIVIGQPSVCCQPQASQVLPMSLSCPCLLLGVCLPCPCLADHTDGATQVKALKTGRKKARHTGASQRLKRRQEQTFIKGKKEGRKQKA